MKALVYEGPKLLNVREQQVPEPGEDDVLIKVERVGICGSEISGYLGHNSLRKPPLIMGHEFAGTVVSAGSRTQRFQPGDRVTVNPLVTCGECRECTTGMSQLCARRKLLGAHLPGAFAQYVNAPEKNVYALSDHVDFDDGAMIEPYACAVHICRLLKLTPTDKLLIVGAGPIGLFTLQAAQVYGVKHIVVADINAGRLAIAAELGAITVASLQDEAPLTYDAAVDAVGLEITRRQCTEYVKPGGRVVFSGLHEDGSKLQFNALIRNEVTITGSFAYSRADFETALSWVDEGRMTLRPWLAHAPLEEGQSCFERLLGDPGGIAKFMLIP
ncbi:galactitol-1-phosphate 5-dehydrogenase [Paenibacillus thalictri]|uniref:Galactitol-1-phosphate 5-dehydrogenase n=2 Tax=Paenibacillus thalictri TaxID=2527873 RepID=A0A4Q9DV42_9BACL|nr:galactitol-1-phosphate 5-dehydrogenase [Paenibacillus thalictri]